MVSMIKFTILLCIAGYVIFRGPFGKWWTV